MKRNWKISYPNIENLVAAKEESQAELATKKSKLVDMQKTLEREQRLSVEKDQRITKLLEKVQIRKC